MLNLCFLIEVNLYFLIEVNLSFLIEVNLCFLIEVNLYFLIEVNLSFLIEINLFYSVCFSTMSSCLNALSAVTWKDILEPFLGKKTETQKTWITRILGAVYDPRKAISQGNTVFSYPQKLSHSIFHSLKYDRLDAMIKIVRISRLC